MSDLLHISNIEQRIFTMRGVQVMLDRDLAIFYAVETRALKQAVKRNLARFPVDFMFELTEDEVGALVSQSVIPSKKQLGGAKPLVFTEQGIFFDGQVFDAYAFVCDLIRAATRRIILIDNYVDESVLTLLAKRKPKVGAQLLTKTISRQLAQDIAKFNAQYPAIEAREFKLAHDRFLIIDDDIYHIGASLKDLGKKWFAFSKMEMRAIDMLAKVNGDG